MPTITLKFKDNAIGCYPIEKGTSLTIGRRKENDIVIDNLAVSGHHARIDCVGETFRPGRPAEQERHVRQRATGEQPPAEARG